ncbi:MAG: hypothetical protein ACMUIG_04035 [Thermoplasmatota archaeon]
MKKRPIFKIVILTQDNETVISSYLLILLYFLKNKVNMKPDITVLDNNSSDRTVDLAMRTGVSVQRYKKTKRRKELVRKVLQLGKASKANTFIILDITGGNDAEDAISLIARSLVEGKRFASAYIHPPKDGGSLGCWAIDIDLLESMEGDPEFDIEKKLEEIADLADLELIAIDEKVSIQSKKQRRNFLKMFKKSPIEMLSILVKYHPLMFYGSIGMFILLMSLISGFYTVDYFYKYNELNYFPAFTTVALMMIGGFFMVAGLMLNALNVLVEKLEAMKKWLM